MTDNKPNKYFFDFVIAEGKVCYGGYGGKELYITYTSDNKNQVYSKENWISAYNEAVAGNYDFITINWLGRLQVTTSVKGFNPDKLIET